jgi:4-hydroxybenzoyl-CoA thioesterase
MGRQCGEAACAHFESDSPTLTAYFLGKYRKNSKKMMVKYWASQAAELFDAIPCAALRCGHWTRGIMATFISRRQFSIEWGHCDPAGIVFNARFFEFFDWGTWTLFERALGVKPPDLAEAFGIIGIPLVDVSANFHGPARFGDAVELSSQMGEMRRSSFDIEHRLTVRGTLAVEGHETRVWAIRDAANPSQIKARPVPEDVVARFHAAQ